MKTWWQKGVGHINRTLRHATVHMDSNVFRITQAMAGETKQKDICFALLKLNLKR